MKTAICISGIGRSLSHVFDNLKDNLIDCWDDRDVYYVLGKSEYSDRSIKLFEKIILFISCSKKSLTISGKYGIRY